MSSTPFDVDAFNAARLDAFVIRARRVAAHSLAQDWDRLVALSMATMTLQISAERTVMRQELPAEETVESAAARVRPLLLADEACYLPHALSAVRHFVADEQVRAWTKAVGAQWRSRTNETSGVRDRGSLVRVADLSTGAKGELNDLQLALAWIYGDVVHHDAERRTGAAVFGLKERYRAAVPLVTYVMVEAANVLEGVRSLHSGGKLPLSETALTTDVVLTDTTFEQVARVHLADIGTEPPEHFDAPLGPEWTPLSRPEPDGAHGDT